MDEIRLVSKDELYHYGVKGMKWGHRKAVLPTSNVRNRYDSAKADFKSAKKAYNKSFNKAYNRNFAMYSPVKKHREANKERWNDAANKAVERAEAKRAYKSAKAARKESINKNYDKIDSKSNFKDKLLYNDATRKKAAKYMTDNNMSMSEARQKANKEALRNTAVFMGAYGAMTVGAMMYMNKR